MRNPRFRQFNNYQRISQDLLQILKREQGSILNLMKKLEDIEFFETL